MLLPAQQSSSESGSTRRGASVLALSSFRQQSLQRRFHRGGTHLVSLCCRMEVVVHDVLRDRAVRLEKRLGDIQIGNAVSLVEFRDALVDCVDCGTCGVRLLAAGKY